jgi:hypothetical protein
MKTKGATAAAVVIESCAEQLVRLSYGPPVSQAGLFRSGRYARGRLIFDEPHHACHPFGNDLNMALTGGDRSSLSHARSSDVASACRR